MKPYLFGALLFASSVIASQAALFTFDSDASVNVANGSLPTSATISFGILEDVYDSEWNVVGEQWIVDENPIDTITIIPADSGFGTSLSDRALYGINQPIMIVFAQAMDIAMFSIFLDDSTFGNPFNSPIEFLDVNGDLITSLDASPSIPNYEVTGAGINGVKTIVLSSGSLYDNMTVTAVPEPAAALIGAFGSLLLLIKRRRF